MQAGKEAVIEHTPINNMVPVMSEVERPVSKHAQVDLESDEFENALWSTTESYEYLDWDALEETLSNLNQ